MDSITDELNFTLLQDTSKIFKIKSKHLDNEFLVIETHSELSIFRYKNHPVSELVCDFNWDENYGKVDIKFNNNTLIKNLLVEWDKEKTRIKRLDVSDNHEYEDDQTSLFQSKLEIDLEPIVFSYYLNNNMILIISKCNDNSAFFELLIEVDLNDKKVAFRFSSNNLFTESVFNI